MQTPLKLLPSALSDLFAQVMTTGRLTVADRYGLLAALLDETISDDELNSIDRLLRSIRRGRVTLVEDLSNTNCLDPSEASCWKIDRQHTQQKKAPRAVWNTTKSDDIDWAMLMLRSPQPAGKLFSKNSTISS